MVRHLRRELDILEFPAYRTTRNSRGVRPARYHQAGLHDGACHRERQGTLLLARVLQPRPQAHHPARIHSARQRAARLHPFVARRGTLPFRRHDYSRPGQFENRNRQERLAHEQQGTTLQSRRYCRGHPADPADLPQGGLPAHLREPRGTHRYRQEMHHRRSEREPGRESHHGQHEEYDAEGDRQDKPREGSRAFRHGMAILAVEDPRRGTHRR